MVHRSDDALIYSKRSRPACVVQVEDRWLVGEVRARRVTTEGTRVEVAYYTDPDTAFLREFAAVDVRQLDEAEDLDWE